VTKIKICGITRVDDAIVAADLGANFIGMVFVPTSPRCVTPVGAAEIVGQARRPGVKFVGVFRDASIETVRAAAESAGLDYVQLHGSESEDDIRRAGVPVIRTFHVRDAMPDTTSAASAVWLLFDTYDARAGGGTGRTFDWSLLGSYERTKPFFLAGGITPENAASAIRIVRPDAIDVASGVESAPGIKDHLKLRTLFERVRRT
jgi:phosphoribosylanthranilate isomerase